MRLWSRPSSKQHASPLALLLTGTFVAIAVWVQATGKGIDLLVLSVAVMVAVALERTVGDWLAELIGAFPAGIVFTLVVVGAAWMVLDSKSGRRRTEDFFAAAEARGYTTVVFSRPEKRREPSAPGRAAPPVPQAAAAVPAANVRPEPAPVEPAAVEPASRARAASEPIEAAARPSGSTAPSTEGSGVGWLFGAAKAPKEPLPTLVAVEAVPARTRPGAAVRLRASVTARGRPLTTGAVAFTVDGVAAGSAALDGDGVAEASYMTVVPGAHEVQAYFRGNAVLAGSSASVTLHVSGAPR